MEKVEVKSNKEFMDEFNKFIEMTTNVYGAIEGASESELYSIICSLIDELVDNSNKPHRWVLDRIAMKVINFNEEQGTLKE